MVEYRPLVSIIIPVYNGANYMRQAIDSAIGQTYENIEIIVVNDGSTDDGETERIALSYGEKIKYYKKENGGCASALNYGIEKMSGEWFSWLSHDDVYFPDKIKRSVDYIAANHLSRTDTVLSCGTMLIDANSNEILGRKRREERCYGADEMFSMFMNGYTLNGCALLIPRDVLKKVGPFRTKYVYILDWIYWIDIALAGCSFCVIPDVLVKNRLHMQQVSQVKKDALKKETVLYIMDLLQQERENSGHERSIWAYCKRVGFAEGCKYAQEHFKMDGKTYCVGVLCRMKYYGKTVFRAIRAKQLERTKSKECT